VLLTDLRDHFYSVLSEAQTQRSDRQSFKHDPFEGRDVPEWMLFERKVMLDEVNRWRENHGAQLLTERQLVKAERLAVGHIDYAQKFSLYCARLAQGEEVN